MTVPLYPRVLLWCPFCSGTAEVHDNIPSCNDCGATIGNGRGVDGEILGFDTEAEAYAAWNERLGC